MLSDRRTFCSGVLSLASLGIASAVRAAGEKEIDRATHTALSAWKVPGAAVGIVREGRIDYLAGHGLRDVDGKKPVTPDTLFPLGSCSKGFITASLAMLADAGKLGWDDPVRKHLDTFRLADPLADNQVSLRDLLCHRTGLGTHDLLWYRPAWTPEEAVRRAGLLPLNLPFRAAFQYQSTMFTALGLALSATAGTPWPEFVEKQLFAPLGMKSAGCSTNSFTTDDRVVGHHLNARGQAATLPEWAPFVRPDAAASIHASARDLCAWLRLHLNHGKTDTQQLVSAAGLRQTHTPQMVLPQSEHEQALHPETHQVSYGMAWVIEDYRGLKVIAHGGVLDGVRVQLTMVPAKRLGLVVLANLHATRMNLALSYTLLDLLLGGEKRDWNETMLKEMTKLHIIVARKRKERSDRRHQGTKPSRTLAAYVGTYDHAGYGTARVVLERGRLVLRYSTFEAEMEHFHYDTFQVRHRHLDEVLFTFALNAGGDVQEMVAIDWFGVVFRRAR